MAMMGLRLAEGIAIDRYAALAGVPFAAEAIDELVALGLVEPADGRITVTDAGRPVLDAVLRKLLA